MKWKLWLKGLLAATINSTAITTVSALTDPEHALNPAKLGATVGVGALTGMLLYLKQSPLPPDNGSSEPPVSITTPPR